jgi:gas vesicle protein
MSERIYYSREAEMRAQRQFLITTAVLAMVSVGIGAVLALLFAPRPGEEVRRDLEWRAAEALARGRETAIKVAAEAQNNLQRVREELDDRLTSS